MLLGGATSAAAFRLRLRHRLMCAVAQSAAVATIAPDRNSQPGPTLSQGHYKSSLRCNGSVFVYAGAGPVEPERGQAFLTNSDLSFMAPNPSILQSML